MCYLVPPMKTKKEIPTRHPVYNRDREKEAIRELLPWLQAEAASGAAPEDAAAVYRQCLHTLKAAKDAGWSFRDLESTIKKKSKR